MKAAITVEKWMSVRIGLYGPVKGLKDQRIIVAITDHKGNNTTVIEVQNSTEIDLVHLNALIPFELCYIGQPFFVGFLCMKIAVKKILGYILWIFCMPRAAVVVVLDGGFDALSPADAKNSFVVYMNMLVVLQIVIDATVALVRVLHVDLLDLLRNLLVLHGPGAPFTGCPTKIGRSGNMQELTGCLNRIVFLCMAFLYSSVQVRLPYL